MREAMVIVPKHDNNGHPLPAVKRKATEMLVRAFGGCTTREAYGHWRDDAGKVISEPVSELVVAYEPSAEHDSELRKVALWVGKAAEQAAVYARYASGDVEIIATREAAALAA